MITEREKFEFDSVPEFVRDPRPNSRDSYSANIAVQDELESKPSIKPAAKLNAKASAAALPKSAELEALWPGVSHEFLHASNKKGPVFYLVLGFVAGILTCVASAGGYSAVTRFIANSAGGKEIVVAAAQPGGRSGQTGSGAVTTLTPANGEPDVIIPLSQSVAVGSGDTLAAIALKNYKRATPRLLDEICKANNMRNANVLSLGQKLMLPEYHPQQTQQSRQLATGGNSVQ